MDHRAMRLLASPWRAMAAGVFHTYRFIVEKEIADGTLKEMLKPYGGCSRPFLLLYPHGQHLSSRVRCFVDFLMKKLGA
jgi:DNA-binding transcriptional LysR family regulator